VVVTVTGAPGVGYYSSGGGEASNQSYYVDDVVQGEPPGLWSGSGAARLGLAGEVDADDMEAVFEQFINPVTGERIGRAPIKTDGEAVAARVASKVAAALAVEPDALPERVEQIRREAESGARESRSGWDATFSVAKSITVAHTAATRAETAARAAGDAEREQQFAGIRVGIEQAILTANATMLDYAETLATTRVGGTAGAPLKWMPAPGLTVATFLQHTSRNIDPQLHVHNVIVNRAFSADGKVRALEGKDMLDAQYALGAVADRVLEEALTAQGFEFALRPDGLGRELTIIDPAVCDLFSSRSREISARVAETLTVAEQRLGRELTDLELHNLKQAATLATRSTKPKGESKETIGELLDRWEAMTVAEVGTSLDSVGDRLSEHLAERLATRDDTLALGNDVEWSPSAVISEALAACAESSATWTRSYLAMQMGRRLPSLGGLDPKSTVAVLDQLVDVALTGDAVRQVSGHRDLPLLDGAEAGVGSGTGEASRGPLAGLQDDPYTRPGSRRYATVDSLDAEHSLRLAAADRAGHRLDAAAVDAWLDQHCPTIGADQRAAVHGLATTDAALAVLVGPAGTGKSYAAGALAGAWADLTDGHGKVLGLAVSQIAAQVLTDDGITHSANIRAWLTAHDRIAAGNARPDDQAWALGSRDLVLVDEASMVATADLNRIRGLVEAAGARMILAGDPHQLDAIEAGGVMGLLDGHAQTYTLSDVRRFEAEWERPASLALRDGRPEALDEYDRHARLLSHPSTDDAIAAAARAAVADRVAGRTSIVVAGTNEQAAAIATQVRDQLIALGLVDTISKVVLGRDHAVAGVGDTIAARRNDHALGVTNRAQYRITAVQPDGSVMVEPLGGNDEGDGSPSQLVLPADYVAADTQLGYAATIHAAQGITVDTAHLVTDGALDPAGLYVAMTRGRIRNTAYVAGARDAADVPYGPAEADTPLPAHAILAGVFEKETTGRAGLVEAERDEARLSNLKTVGGRIDDIAAAACRDRLERHLDDLVDAGILSEAVRARLGADQSTSHLSALLRVVEQAGHDPRSVLAKAVSSRGLDDADSVAQVLSHRITGHYGTPSPDVLTVGEPGAATAQPSDVHPTAERLLTHLTARALTRAEQLGAVVAQERPAWAIDSLGPVPDADTEARVAWQAKAGDVAAYREAASWDDPYRAIDTLPGLRATERRAMFARAWHALGQPAEAIDDARLTEGQLRVRMRAAEAELAWAPPHADDALRAAETVYEQARQEVALAEAAATQAEALGDAEMAERLRAEAAEAAVVAAGQPLVIDQLTRAAEARSQWAAAAAVTLDFGNRARLEATRRGLDIEHPSDETTTPEFLARGNHVSVRDGQERAALLEAAPLEEAVHLEAPETLDDLRLIDKAELSETVPAEDVDSDHDEPRPAREETSSHVLVTDLGIGPMSERRAGQSPAHERVPVNPTAGELDLLIAAASVAVHEVAERRSIEAAHVDPDIEEMYAEDTHDAERHHREAIDHDTGTAPEWGRPPAASTAALDDADVDAWDGGLDA
jgi:conjugative relaxase-like TrwC/TraI family protein